MQGPLPDGFMTSYRDHPQYPCNLIPQNTKAYPWELEQHKVELAVLSPRLCLKDERGIELPIRDIWTRLDCSIGASKWST